MALSTSKASKMRKKRMRKVTMMTSEDGTEFVGAHQDIDDLTCTHWLPFVNVLYDIIFDVPPTLEQLKEMLNLPVGFLQSTVSD